MNKFVEFKGLAILLPLNSTNLFWTKYDYANNMSMLLQSSGSGDW